MGAKNVGPLRVENALRHPRLIRLEYPCSRRRTRWGEEARRSDDRTRPSQRRPREPSIPSARPRTDQEETNMACECGRWAQSIRSREPPPRRTNPPRLAYPSPSPREIESLTPQRIFSLIPRPNNNTTTTCRSKHMCYLRSFRKSLSKVFLKRQRSKQLLCKTASRQST